MNAFAPPVHSSLREPREAGAIRRMAYGVGLVLLIALAAATGAVKLAQLPDEMRIYATVGFSDLMTVAFGIIQIAAALLLVAPSTRRIGAALIIATFVFATYVLFVNAVHPFSLLSLSFIALALPPLLAPRSRTP